MLDITKYEYFDLNLPNIKAEWPKGRIAKVDKFAIDHRIRDFIVTLATQHPSWTFVSKNMYLSREETCYETDSFNVYDNREKLGQINYDTNRNGEVVYVIQNHRISSARERGNAAKTKDIRKAVKIVNKSFGTKTVSEKILDAIEKTHSPMHHAFHTKHMEFSEGYRALTFAMQKHIMSNWEESMRIAIEAGVKEEELAKLSHAYQEHIVTTKIWNAFANSTGLIVYITGKDYAVHRRDCKLRPDDSAAVEVLGSENLPEWLRRNIGLLKLIEPKQYLRDVGFRINESAFFLLDKEGDTNE